MVCFQTTSENTNAAFRQSALTCCGFFRGSGDGTHIFYSQSQTHQWFSAGRPRQDYTFAGHTQSWGSKKNGLCRELEVCGHWAGKLQHQADDGHCFASRSGERPQGHFPPRDGLGLGGLDRVVDFQVAGLFWPLQGEALDSSGCRGPRDPLVGVYCDVANSSDVAENAEVAKIGRRAAPLFCPQRVGHCFALA